MDALFSLGILQVQKDAHLTDYLVHSKIFCSWKEQCSKNNKKFPVQDDMASNGKWLTFF